LVHFAPKSPEHKTVSNPSPIPNVNDGDGAGAAAADAAAADAATSSASAGDDVGPPTPVDGDLRRPVQNQTAVDGHCPSQTIAEDLQRSGVRRFAGAVPRPCAPGSAAWAAAVSGRPGRRRAISPKLPSFGGGGSGGGGSSGGSPGPGPWPWTGFPVRSCG